MSATPADSDRQGTPDTSLVLDEPVETTVELAAHRGESDLAHLDLGDDTEPATA